MKVILMDNSAASEGFSAMGSQSRLLVLRTLVKAGDSGLSVGDIGAKTKIPASTLNHHLNALMSADLILQEKVGRSIINRANYDHLVNLAEFILSECCIEEQ